MLIKNISNKLSMKCSYHHAQASDVQALLCFPFLSDIRANSPSYNQSHTSWGMGRKGSALARCLWWCAAIHFCRWNWRSSFSTWILVHWEKDLTQPLKLGPFLGAVKDLCPVQVMGAVWKLKKKKVQNGSIYNNKQIVLEMQKPELT